MDQAIKICGSIVTAVSVAVSGWEVYKQIFKKPPEPSQPSQYQPRSYNRRDIYPDEDESSSNPNLDFYQNKIPSKPNGAKFEEIISEWYGNHEKLIRHTGYIQWLFPNREAGLNLAASPLTEEEARAIRSDPVLRERVRRAFKMILDLYGMTLNAKNEFKLTDDDPEFLEHFIGHRVSNMWVTRILKALKDLGHQELMLPWLKFLKKLIYEDRILPDKFRASFTGYWIETLDAADREMLMEGTGNCSLSKNRFDS